MRNMWAVQTPMPFTWVRCAMTSSSDCSGRRAKSSRPEDVFSAKSFRYADFCFDKPTLRSCSSVSLRMPAGVSGSPASAAKRSKIVAGALPVRCWETVDLGQAGKLRRTKLHAARAHALDHGAHDGVTFLEVVDGFAHGFYFYHNACCDSEGNANIAVNAKRLGPTRRPRHRARPRRGLVSIAATPPRLRPLSPTRARRAVPPGRTGR